MINLILIILLAKLIEVVFDMEEVYLFVRLYILYIVTEFILKISVHI